MPTINKNQQAECRVAQLFEALSRHRLDPSTLERILAQIDDKNFKVIGVKSWKGCTALHIANIQKHIEAFDSLLKQGVDFTIKTDKGFTALHQAFYDIFSEKPISTYGVLKNKFVNSVLMAHSAFAVSENPRTNEGLSHFHIACAYNHLEAVQLFLNSGVSVNESVNANSTKFAGYSPLHFAARFCGYATAKYLLDNGADSKAKDVKGLTPLHLLVNYNWKLFYMTYDDADEETLSIISEDSSQGSLDSEKDLDKCKMKNDKIIKMFLENNAVVGDDATGFCKIHAACTLSDSKFAENFLRSIDVNCAVSVNSSMWPGYTPLHFAAHFNVSTIKLLLKNGADIAAKDAVGETPFDICMKKYNLKSLDKILSHASVLKDIYFSDNKIRLMNFINVMRSHSSLDKFFETAPKDVCLPRDCPLWPGYYLSHLAVIFFEKMSYRQQKLVINDIEDSLNLDCTQDALGRTAIHLAFYQKKYIIINWCVMHRSKISDVTDKNDLSLLHIFCERTHELTVKSLLSKGADANRNYRGRALTSGLNTNSTPLHFAVAGGNTKIVKMLLQHGANANATDANGMTPIHCVLTLCPYSSRKEISDLLFSSCELQNVVTKSGLSHLHVASYTGNEIAVDGLVKLGADVNAVFSSEIIVFHDGVMSKFPAQFMERTPLNLAVMQNHVRVVKILLQAGADVLQKKANGMTLMYEILNDCGDDLPLKFGDTYTKIYFASMIKNDAALRNRVQQDTGINLLHVACALYDVDQIKSLLKNSQCDVNAQIDSNSPIWNKSTPLHLLIHFGHDISVLNRAMQPLLENNADIMLTDRYGNNPLHSFLAQEERYRSSDKTISNYDILGSLVTYHKDFSLNPINEDGISHFHVACMTSQSTIVEQFLKNDVDVNLPINQRKGTPTFQTPLHLVFEPRFEVESDAESQLRTIDVLLRYGADVNAQEADSYTPLFLAACARPSRELFFDMLIKAGADINYTNLNGYCVLEILLRSRDPPTIDEFLFFVYNNVNFNIFNPISQEGILSKIYSVNKAFFLKIISTSSLLALDRMGRTPIHNIVASNNSKGISKEKYVDCIERIIKLGYDVDAQDCAGRTALHLAAWFANGNAILALLNTGADIDITDANNTVAFRRNGRIDEYWETHDEYGSVNYDVAVHIYALKKCNIQVDHRNWLLAWKDLISSNDEWRYCMVRMSHEFDHTKYVKIGNSSFTLQDFLSETGPVVSRPWMTSQDDREAVDNLFELVDLENCRYFRSVLKLQYKKMMMRLRLMEPAAEALKNLVGIVNGFRMPDLCCRMIIRFLSHTDVKNLITSSSI